MHLQVAQILSSNKTVALMHAEDDDDDNGKVDVPLDVYRLMRSKNNSYLNLKAFWWNIWGSLQARLNGLKMHLK